MARKKRLYCVTDLRNGRIRPVVGFSKDEALRFCKLKVSDFVNKKIIVVEIKGTK